jgi:flagellar biosynthesis/type III secretory pathway M-ring protein FliF/YscJ
MGEKTDDRMVEGRWARIRKRASTAWPWVVVVGASAVAVALWAVPAPEAPSPEEALSGIRRAARQREIAKMVESLSDVVSATVLLRESDGAASDAASVAIEMRVGSTLGPETASAIAGLVASAAPGVDPADVVVVDSRDPARTHRLAPDADVAHKGAALLRLRERVERALADKIRGFFAGMQIESVVVVSAKLELDEIKERILTLDPDRRGEFVVSEERSSGVARQPSGATTGASVNRAASLPGLDAPRDEGGEFRKTESIVSYVTQEIAKTGKGLSDVSASVVLFDRLVHEDGTWKYDRSVEKNLDDYQALVARALGASDIRNVEIKYLKSPWSTPPVTAVAEQSSIVAGIGQYIALGVAALFALLAVIIASTRRARTTPVEAAPVEQTEESEGSIPPGEKLRREATRIVTEDVERAAAVLGRWVMREAS